MALPQGVGAIATDSNVPEGHEGLHGFLYGEAGAEVHDDEGQEYQSREVGALASPSPSSSSHFLQLQIQLHIEVLNPIALLRVHVQASNLPAT